MGGCPSHKSNEPSFSFSKASRLSKAFLLRNQKKSKILKKKHTTTSTQNLSPRSEDSLDLHQLYQSISTQAVDHGSFYSPSGHLNSMEQFHQELKNELRLPPLDINDAAIPAFQTPLDHQNQHWCSSRLTDSVEEPFSESHALLEGQTTKFPTGSNVFWPAFLSHPSGARNLTEDDLYFIIFRRFAVAISFFCCHLSHSSKSKDSKWYPWFKERQRRRVCLYLAERLLYETYTFFFFRLNSNVPEKFLVLPTEIDFHDYDEWISVEQGGIEGPSMIPSQYRGNLFTSSSDNDTTNDTSPTRSFFMAFELEPLCFGLLWKRMLCSGIGWRRPGFRSIVTLRYCLFSTSTSQTSLDNILHQAKTWNTLTLVLLDPLTRADLMTSHHEKEQQQLTKAVLDVFPFMADTTFLSSKLFYFLQTLVHAMIVTSKTMLQGEICAVASPFFNCLTTQGKDSFLLLLNLDTWSFVTPLLKTNGQDSTPPLLILEKYYRTFSVKGDYHRLDDFPDVAGCSRSSRVDEKPSNDCAVRIHICPCLNTFFPLELSDETKTLKFEMASSRLPQCLTTAMSYFTVSTSGFIRIPLDELHDTLLCEIFPFIQQLKEADSLPSRSYQWFYVKLIKIKPSLSRNSTLKSSSGLLQLEIAQLLPLSQYNASLNNLGELDHAFYQEASYFLNSRSDEDAPTTTQKAQVMKPLQTYTSWNQLSISTPHMTHIKDMLDDNCLDLKSFNLFPCLFSLGNTQDLWNSMYNIVYEMHQTPITSWKCHPSSLPMWTAFQMVSKNFQRDFILQPYTCPLMVLATDFWVGIATIPSNSHLGLRHLIQALCQWSHSRKSDVWTNILYSLLKRQVSCLKQSVLTLSDPMHAVVQKILKPTTMSLEKQGLTLLYPHAICWDLVPLPSFFSIWQRSDGSSEHEVESNGFLVFLQKRIEQCIVSASVSSISQPTPLVSEEPKIIQWNSANGSIEYIMPTDVREEQIDNQNCLKKFQEFIKETLHSDFCPDAFSDASDLSPPSRVMAESPFFPRVTPHTLSVIYLRHLLLSFKAFQGFFYIFSETSLHEMDPYELIPLKSFTRELRHCLCKEENVSFHPHALSSIAFHECVEEFLKRWKNHFFFKRLNVFSENIEPLCVDFEHHLTSRLLMSLPQSLISIIHKAHPQDTTCFTQCAPLAAALLIKRTINVFQHFMTQIDLSPWIESFQEKFSSLLNNFSNYDSLSQQDKNVQGLFTLCFLLAHRYSPMIQPSMGLLVLRWASKLPLNPLIDYLFEEKERGFQFNGTCQVTSMYSRLCHGLLLQAIMTRTSHNYFFLKDSFSHTCVEHILFAAVNYNSNCHSYRRFLTHWFSCVQSKVFCLPSLRDISLLLFLIQPSPCGSPIPFLQAHHVYTWLILLSFRSLMAFDPWLGSFLPISSSTYILASKKDNQALTPLSCLSILGEWLSIYAWLKPVLSMLNEIVFEQPSNDSSLTTKKPFSVPLYLKCLLLLSNALFKLYTAADLVGFENELQYALSLCSNFPELTLFCCSTLISLHYIMGKGQEETAETQDWASQFRLTRKLFYKTPFHIGLPQPCPKTLSSSTPNHFPSIIHQLETLQSRVTISKLYCSDQQGNLAAQSILRTLVTECLPTKSKDSGIQISQTDGYEKYSIIEHLLWNIMTFTAPDIFLWLEACVICPTILSLQMDHSLTSVYYVSEKHIFSKIQNLMNRTPYKSYKKLRSSRVMNITPQSFTKFHPPYELESKYVLSCGDNATAGCLGVGMPRYLKHKEAFYDIVPEFGAENMMSMLQGVDVCLAGNPVVVFLEDEPLKVAAGDYHTVVLTKNDHALFVWGSNLYGQCCAASPPVQDSGRWRSRLFSALLDHDTFKDTTNSLRALLRDQVFHWLFKKSFSNDPNSSNAVASVELEHTSQIAVGSLDKNYDKQNNLLDTALVEPQRLDITFLDPQDYLVEVYAGSTFSIARSSVGRLVLWGSLWDGCLARLSKSEPNLLLASEVAQTFRYRSNEGSKNITTSTLDLYLTSRLHRIRQVATGTLHVAALDCFGGLWLWGQSEAGQLGFSPSFFKNVIVHHPSLHINAVCTPHRLRLFLYPCTSSSLHFSTMPLHPSNTSADLLAALRSRATMFLNELRLDHAMDKVVQEGHFTCRFASHLRILILGITDYALYNWSQLDPMQLFSPAPLTSAELEFQLISCGEGHTLAFGVQYINTSPSKKHHWLLSWGQSNYGQLGLENPQNQWSINLHNLLLNDRHSPLIVPESDTKWTPCIVDWPKNIDSQKTFPLRKLCSGGCSNVALLRNGQPTVWGSNDFGILGFDEQRYHEIYVPQLMNPLFESPLLVRHVIFSRDGARCFFISDHGHTICLGKDRSGANGRYICMTRSFRFLSEDTYSQLPEINRIDFPQEFNVSLLASGVAHTVFIPV